MMENSSLDFVLSENQQIIQSGTDAAGNIIFYVIANGPEDKDLATINTSDLAYSFDSLCNQLSTDTVIDSTAQLSTGQPLSVSTDAVYQMGTGTSVIDNCQLSMQNSIDDKVRVEIVNPEQRSLTVNDFTNQNIMAHEIATDMLSTGGDIILSSTDHTGIHDPSTFQMQNSSLPFTSAVTSSHQALGIQSTVDASQILINEDSIQDLKNLLDDVDDGTITTTTAENLEHVITSASINVNRINRFMEPVPPSIENPVVLQKPSLMNCAPEVQYQTRPKLDRQFTNGSNETANKNQQKMEFMSREDTNMLRKSVSNYCPDFSTYPKSCHCQDGTEIPVEQIWLHKNQMYYLPQINIVVISFEEYVGFIRQDKVYVSVGEITQRLIPNFKNEVESYLVRIACDKQFLSLEEIEYLKQRKCIGPNTKSGTMISLDTLRSMCKFLASTKSFIQAPTIGLANAAHGIIYRKVFEKHTRCSRCGGVMKDVDVPDRYTVLDANVISIEPGSNMGKSLKLHESEKSMFIGEVSVDNVVFKAFKLNDVTYISLKELIENHVFTLQNLQARLVQLQYRPRPAPTVIDHHFMNEQVDVNQTLWIDLMTVRCACCMSRQRSPGGKTESLQQKFSRGHVSCEFGFQIIGFDDTDSSVNNTVYTLDPHTYKITTKHNQSDVVSMSRKCTSTLNSTANSVTQKSKKLRDKVTIKKPFSGLKHRTESPAVTDDKVSLMPGVYYFTDGKDIVEFLKTNAIGDVATGMAEDERKTEVTRQEEPDLLLSKPIKFRVKTAPRPNESSSCIVTSGLKEVRQSSTGEVQLLEIPEKGDKSKQTGTGKTVSLQSRKDNDVSSSVPCDPNSVSSHPSLSQEVIDHGSELVEFSGMESRAKSPEVQDKNVDSTAVNPAEIEPDYMCTSVQGHSGPSSTVESPLEKYANLGMGDASIADSNNVCDIGEADFDMQGDFLCPAGSFDEMQNEHNPKTSLFGKSNADFSTPSRLRNVCSDIVDSLTSTPLAPTEDVCLSAGQLRETKMEKATSYNKSHQFPRVKLLKARSPRSTWSTRTKVQGDDLETSTEEPASKRPRVTSPMTPEKQVVAPNECLRTNFLSPDSAGVFTTPSVSPIFDRTLGRKSDSQTNESLDDKHVSVPQDDSSENDSFLHVLATVASDLENIPETVSDKILPCTSHLSSAYVDVCDANFPSLQNVKTGFVSFFEQLFDHVEIVKDSFNVGHVKLKFCDTAKDTFPALWKEPGHARLHTLVGRLVQMLVKSSTEELQCTA